MGRKEGPGTGDQGKTTRGRRSQTVRPRLVMWRVANPGSIERCTLRASAPIKGPGLPEVSLACGFFEYVVEQQGAAADDPIHEKRAGGSREAKNGAEQGLLVLHEGAASHDGGHASGDELPGHFEHNNPHGSVHHDRVAVAFV